jgi:hypothetical protein
VPSFMSFKVRVSVDKALVLKAAADATRIVTGKQGAVVRKTAMWRIRTSRKPSQPGNPPHSHTGILKRFLVYSWDPSTKTTVVGPMATNQIYFNRHRQPVKGTVPQILEEGGDITILEVFKYGRWQRADLRSRRRLAGLPRRYRTAHIKARPYMGPALAEAKSKLPALWANSIKR